MAEQLALIFYTADEKDIHTKHDLQITEKNLIAKKAASLVKPHDLIYIDAGTTTELIIDHLTEKKSNLYNKRHYSCSKINW